MTGPKTNEGATEVGERTGTRSTAKYVRSSAYKAREVLDLIRGLDVRRADQVLQFTDREVARAVRKVLASAVANAIHNDEQDPDELYVRACFADEGPTLRRFRPRARGRATRVRKRTCHITIVIDRMSEEQLRIKAIKEAAHPQTAGRARRVAGSTAAAARRARVERSRQARAAGDGAVGEATETTEIDDTELPIGAHAPLDDGSQPDGFPIKGNADSMLYHTPDSPHYDQTVPEIWFASEDDAEAAGYSKPKRQQDAEDKAAAEAEEAEAEGTDETDEVEGAEGSAGDEAHAAPGQGEADAEAADGEEA
jgi:large subunit ribosomal protein L22